MYWIHTTNTYIPQDMPIQMKRIVMDWYFLRFQYLPVCTHNFTDEARIVIAQSTWSSRLLVSSEKSLGITRDLGLHDIEQIIMLSSTSQPSRWLRLPSWEIIVSCLRVLSHHDPDSESESHHLGDTGTQTLGDLSGFSPQFDWIFSGEALNPIFSLQDAGFLKFRST